MKKLTEIVVLSGKGGTGKTTITAAFASLSKKTIFTDCDVDASDLHLVLSPEIFHSEDFPSGSKAIIKPSLCNRCGMCSDLCRFDAISTEGDIPKIEEYACEGCGLCAKACPVNAISMESYFRNRVFHAQCRFGFMVYGKLGIAEENSGRLVSRIRQDAKSLALEYAAEFILTDGPPGIGCPAISSVSGSDLVIAITEPTLSGWHDLQRLLEMIKKFRTPVRVIINKYDLNEEMTELIRQKSLEKGAEVISLIPYDENMILSLLEGQSIIEYQPDGILAAELKKTWERILSEVNAAV